MRDLLPRIQTRTPRETIKGNRKTRKWSTLV